MAAGGLDEAHEKVRDAALRGVPADFSEPDDPDELPAYEDDEHWAGRTVDGEWLADFLVDEAERKHRRGVDIVGARIRGGLDLNWATVDRPLRLASCQLGAHRISLVDAHLRSIRLPDSACGGLVGDGARVTGDVFLRGGFSATGPVRLLGVTIGGDVACEGGTFTNPGGHALALDRARITGGVFLGNHLTAIGAVRLLGATIGGNVECDGGCFTNPLAQALSLDGAQVTGHVFLRNGFLALGQVGLLGATIGGNLSCTGGTFTNPEGGALFLDGARITGGVFLREGSRFEGSVSLVSASAEALGDDEASWPPRLGLEGFTYTRLYSPDDGWKRRREWLGRQLRPSPLAYLQLAAVYRSAGDERSARKILMERHNARLRPPQHWKDQLPKGPWGWVRRSGRWFLRLTIGHGYEPWRVLGFALPLLLAMTLWYADARRHDVLVPARATGAVASHCDDQQVCVQPFVYALDTLVPLVELRQRSEWMPDQSRRSSPWYRDGRWLAAATWTTSLLGWVFATLVAASFTQVVRRE